MSASAARIPLERARALAEEVVSLLEPMCERIEIAGSIRRERPDVGDLEIVCVPRLAELPVQRDLFGNAVHVPGAPTKPDNLLDLHVAGLIELGLLGKRLNKNGQAAVGERYKRLSYEGAGLDLFSVVPGTGQQWGAIFTIRTGCADFSHRLVTPRTLGGWMPIGLREHDGGLRRGETRVETPEEADFFAALGLPWLAPALRTSTVRPYRREGAWHWREPAAPTKPAPSSSPILTPRSAYAGPSY